MNSGFRAALWLFIGFYLLTAFGSFMSVYFGSDNENIGNTFFITLFAIFLMVTDRFTKSIDLSKKKLAATSFIIFLLFFSVIIWHANWGRNYKWNGHGFTNMVKQEEKERLSEALLHYDSLISKNPQSDTAFYKKGFFLQGQHEYKAATEEYKKAIAINPKNVNACFQCAWSYELMADTLNAIKYYKQVLETDTGNSYVKGNIKLLIAKYQKN